VLKNEAVLPNNADSAQTTGARVVKPRNTVACVGMGGGCAWAQPFWNGIEGEMTWRSRTDAQPLRIAATPDKMLTSVTSSQRRRHVV
jgi:hypothetical protein